MGHSVGRWEGDVLVVDTIGTSGRTRGMNGVGSNARVSSDDRNPRLPVSDQLHLVERLRLVADGEILEDEMTITDPKIYTKPWVSQRKVFRLLTKEEVVVDGWGALIDDRCVPAEEQDFNDKVRDPAGGIVR